ncbi:hypothetical protein EI94DRAFT_1740285 [Lactarius quietus]|nr:hypothetical protein EI94DRAFT_1740285 [Lactarius quietus]
MGVFVVLCCVLGKLIGLSLGLENVGRSRSGLRGSLALLRAGSGDVSSHGNSGVGHTNPVVGREEEVACSNRGDRKALVVLQGHSLVSIKINRLAEARRLRARSVCVYGSKINASSSKRGQQKHLGLIDKSLICGDLLSIGLAKIYAEFSQLPGQKEPKKARSTATRRYMAKVFEQASWSRSLES